MYSLDMDRATAHAVLELQRTQVGELLVNWMSELVEGRKNLLVSHRSILQMPEVWHDQGFIAGVANVGLLFKHAQMIIDSEEEDQEEPLELPDPVYLGASPEQPRRT